MCEAFGCTPDAALRQDAMLVEEIIEYRAARTARDLFNAPNKRWGFDQLAAHPALIELLARMRRAQAGAPLDVADETLWEEGMQVATGSRATPDEPDEET